MSDAPSPTSQAILPQCPTPYPATVYLARDEKHNRNVALKVLKPELAAIVGAERFLAEIGERAGRAPAR